MDRILRRRSAAATSEVRRDRGSPAACRRRPRSRRGRRRCDERYRRRRRPPADREEPGGLQVFDWAGYGDGTYYPKEEKQFLWQAYQDATGDTPSSSCSRTTTPAIPRSPRAARYDVVHPCGYKYKVGWIWGGAAVGHLADLKLLFAEPQPHVVRRGRRTAVLHPARLGFIALAREPRPRRHTGGVVRDPVRRPLRGRSRGSTRRT